VVGMRGVLKLDDLQPGVLPGRLIEMAVYADETLHGGWFVGCRLEVSFILGGWQRPECDFC
jgi:hypothetical protein